MKINLHSPVEEPQIQIVPLIDVVFCILTFFLLAAVQFTRQQAINVDLPTAVTGTSAEVPSSGGREILPVTLDAVGQLYVEKQPVDREKLAQIIQAYRQQNPNGVLVLNASRSATYNDVVQLLDLLRQLGGDRVALATIPGSSEPLPNNPAPAVTPVIPGVPGVPVAPGATQLPNSPPISPPNPSGIPNPNLIPPTGTNQLQIPTNPGGQVPPPVNPGGVKPVFPTVPQVPIAPGSQAPGTAPVAPPAPTAPQSAPAPQR